MIFIILRASENLYPPASNCSIAQSSHNPNLGAGTGQCSFKQSIRLTPTAYCGGSRD